MLLDRVTPRDGAVELSRVIEAWKKGGKLVPSFNYGPAPELSELRAELLAAADRSAGRGPLFVLYAERARELELEARLAEAVGQPEFAALAALRFSGSARRTAIRPWRSPCSYAGLSVHKADEALHASDDASDSQSLVSQMRKRVAELGLGVRVEVRPQAAVAAVGEGLIAIRPRVWLHGEAGSKDRRPRDARSRAAAQAREERKLPGCSPVGSAKSAETEEGERSSSRSERGCSTTIASASSVSGTWPQRACDEARAASATRARSSWSSVGRWRRRSTSPPGFTEAVAWLGEDRQSTACPRTFRR